MPDSSFANFTFNNGTSATTSVVAASDGQASPNNVQQGWKYQARVTGTGNVSATVVIQGSMWADGPWVDLATITVASAAAPATDTADRAGPYRYHRANVTALTGTNAAVAVAGMGATL